MAQVLWPSLVKWELKKKSCLQDVHEKMLNIANHQGNANQSHRGCHRTPVRMTIIKMNTNNKYWWACGEKGSLVHCWRGCKLVLPLWKTLWRFLKKLKVEPPSNSIPGYVSRKKHSLKRYVHPSVHSSIIYNCHDMEAIYMSIHIRMDKEDVVYIYWRRKWQPTPVFLPRESGGQKSLMGYCP